MAQLMFAGALLLLAGAVVGYIVARFLPPIEMQEEVKETPYDKYRDLQTGLYSRKAVLESKGKKVTS